MEAAIQLLAAISFLIAGASHVLQPVAWAQFFIDLRERGTTGVFCAALLGLPVGVLILSFHNVWTGLPVILTVLGWGYAAKASLYLIAPAVGARMLARISTDRVVGFRVAGGGLLALSALCFGLRFGWIG